MTPLGIDPGTVRLVAQCLNRYATPNCVGKILKFILFPKSATYTHQEGPTNTCKHTTTHRYILIFTLDAEQLARSQYPCGPATGHLDTGFSWFPCVYKRMLRRFSSFQVATTCLSCSPPDLNFLVTFFFIFVYM